MYIYIYTCMYIYIQTYIHIHIFLHIYIHTYIDGHTFLLVKITLAHTERKDMLMQLRRFCALFFICGKGGLHT